MEDVLAVYRRPYDETCPAVCLDETNRQLIGETRLPRPVQPGKPALFDYGYARNGVYELFMFVAPLLGWWRAEITKRRTRKDWARQIKKPVDEDFLEAAKIILVMDNLNTHTAASLYETFEPQEANRIRSRLEIHYTPKHGSRLNMAEIELSVINNHGLSGRVPAIEQMTQQTRAWNLLRNQKACEIDRRFTTADARIKLKRLYLQFSH